MPETIKITEIEIAVERFMDTWAMPRFRLEDGTGSYQDIKAGDGDAARLTYQTFRAISADASAMAATVAHLRDAILGYITDVVRETGLCIPSPTLMYGWRIRPERRALGDDGVCHYYARFGAAVVDRKFMSVVAAPAATMAAEASGSLNQFMELLLKSLWSRSLTPDEATLISVEDGIVKAAAVDPYLRDDKPVSRAVQAYSSPFDAGWPLSYMRGNELNGYLLGSTGQPVEPTISDTEVQRIKNAGFDWRLARARSLRRRAAADNDFINIAAFRDRVVTYQRELDVDRAMGMPGPHDGDMHSRLMPPRHQE